MGDSKMLGVVEAKVSMIHKASIWDYPLYYDVALHYRDYRSDVAQMCKWNFKFGLARPKRILEVACGPANHLIEFARLGVAQCIGVDYSGKMVTYAKTKARKLGYDLDIRNDDMRTFRIRPQVDFAFCPLFGINYLLNVEDIKRHLAIMASNVRVRGIYILEMIHPRDVLDIERPGIPWQSSQMGITVTTQWATRDDTFDPVRQISNTHIRYSIKNRTANTKIVIQNQVQDRIIWRDELRLIIESVRRWKIVGWYGSLSKDITLDHPKAEQMVCIIKKVS